jgi:hypothetical protein
MNPYHAIGEGLPESILYGQSLLGRRVIQADLEIVLTRRDATHGKYTREQKRLPAQPGY